MYARVTRSTASGDIDEALAYVKEKSIPAVRGLTGCKGVLYLVDRDAKKAVAISLWEDEASLRANEEESKKIRSDALAATSGTIDSTDVYEVAIQEFM